MPLKPSIRCSSLPQLLLCPGSRTLAARIAPKKDEGSAVMHEGNWGHWHTAARLIREQGASGPEIIITVAAHPVALADDRDIDEYVVCDETGLPPPKCPADYRPSPFAQWMSNFCFDAIVEGLDNTWWLIVEQDFAYEFERFHLTGHPDVVALKMERIEGEAEPQIVEAILWDEKYGAIAVDPADVNEQIHGYFTLMVCEYRYLRKLTCRILQPRNDESTGLERISEIVVEGRPELIKTADALKRKINEALNNPNAINSDGGKQCRYCPAVLQCPAIKGDIKEMKLILTEEEIAQIKPEAPIEDLVALYDDGRKLGPVFESAHDAFKARVVADGGLTLPDGRVASVKPRKGKRTITDTAKAVEALGDLSDPNFYRCIEIKPGATEEVLAEVHGVPVGGKKAVTGKTLYQDRLGKLTEQSESMVLTVG